MAVTLADVAARAGVSPATVSRVLNGNYPVAEETRRRVERAVRDLDYVVNAHARALLHATSGMIGVILADVADPFFGAIAKGIHAAAADLRRLVVVCTTEGNQAEELAYIEMLRRQRAEVVILVAGSAADRSYRRELSAHARGLKAQGARLVLCGRPAISRALAVGHVTFESAAASKALAEHLVTAGHQRIAYIAGPSNLSIATDRHTEFSRALQQVGLELDERLTIAGDFSRQSGYDAVKRLLASGANFTAVCAANDLMAIGALAAFREAGVRVPDDVSLAGFDDIPGAQDVTPALTTVRLPLEQAGRRAVSLAFAGAGFTEPVRITAQLVVRESVAPARRRRLRTSA
ncbi:MAG TPA: LacI family DNA-binding transcriptional regulator [Actinopolymorphaceae bacterium]